MILTRYPEPRPAVSVAEIQQHPAECKNIPVRFDLRRDGIAWATGIWPLQSIVVGRGWFALPGGEQEAALLHEVGHCKAHHMSQRLLLSPFCWLPTVQRLARAQEHAADAFAVHEGRGADLLRLIFRLRTAPRTETENLLSPAPDERIRRILKLLQEMKR